MNHKNIYGIIISAGLSGRMGKFKPLLSYKGKSFVQNIVNKLQPNCDKIIIVTGHKAKEVEENVNELNIRSKIYFVFNPDYEMGMFTSLQKGISEANKSDWILYHFVDQPGLPEKFYSEFINEIDDSCNWIQPVNKGQKGHPILIKNDLLNIILESSVNSNLREISDSPSVKKKFWDCSFEEIHQDIDTMDDYNSMSDRL